MPVVLCGDFNAHHSSWSRAATSTAGQQLRDYCDNSGLAVLNVLFCRHEPTMHGAHAATVDLVLSSHPDHFSSLSCDPSTPLSSDHIPLLLRLAPGGGMVPRAPAVAYTRWDIEHADWPLFCMLLSTTGPEVLASLHSALNPAQPHAACDGGGMAPLP